MSSKLTTIWWLKKSQRNDKPLEKERLPVITWTKKDSSKQVASITYKLEKKKNWLWGLDLISYLQVFSLMGQSVNLVTKIAV